MTKTPSEDRMTIMDRQQPAVTSSVCEATTRVLRDKFGDSPSHQEAVTFRIKDGLLFIWSGAYQVESFALYEREPEAFLGAVAKFFGNATITMSVTGRIVDAPLFQKACVAFSPKEFHFSGLDFSPTTFPEQLLIGRSLKELTLDGVSFGHPHLLGFLELLKTNRGIDFLDMGNVSFLSKNTLQRWEEVMEAICGVFEHNRCLKWWNTDYPDYDEKANGDNYVAFLKATCQKKVTYERLYRLLKSNNHTIAAFGKGALFPTRKEMQSAGLDARGRFTFDVDCNGDRGGVGLDSNILEGALEAEKLSGQAEKSHGRLSSLLGYGSGLLFPARVDPVQDESLHLKAVNAHFNEIFSSWTNARERLDLNFYGFSHVMDSSNQISSESLCAAIVQAKENGGREVPDKFDRPCQLSCLFRLFQTRPSLIEKISPYEIVCTKKRVETNEVALPNRKLLGVVGTTPSATVVARYAYEDECMRMELTQSNRNLGFGAPASTPSPSLAGATPSNKSTTDGSQRQSAGKATLTAESSATVPSPETTDSAPSPTGEQTKKLATFTAAARNGPKPVERQPQSSKKVPATDSREKNDMKASNGNVAARNKSTKKPPLPKLMIRAHYPSGVWKTKRSPHTPSPTNCTEAVEDKRKPFTTDAMEIGSQAAKRVPVAEEAKPKAAQPQEVANPRKGSRHKKRLLQADDSGDHGEDTTKQPTKHSRTNSMAPESYPQNRRPNDDYESSNEEEESSDEEE